MATGLEKVAVCHPGVFPAEKAAWANSAPDAEYNSPICVPLFCGDPLEKRIPLTAPATSERNFMPRVTGLLSGYHGCCGLIAMLFHTPVDTAGGVTGGGVTGGGLTGGGVTGGGVTGGGLTDEPKPVGMRLTRSPLSMP